MKNLTFLLSFLALAACAPQNPNLQSPDSQETADSIVGGRRIDVSDIEGQSTVGLYSADVGYICTGTLIAPQVILTAAHCIDPQSKQFVAIFAPEMKNAKKEQVRRVVQTIVHPQYTHDVRAKDMYDVALVKFEGAAPAGYKVAPMLVSPGLLKKGASTIVAGYGLSWTIGPKAGAGTLRTTTLKVDDPNYSNTEIQLDQSIRRGICSGDSGGPAYVNIDGHLYVWGVASRGDSLPGWLTPKCMIFSIFTRVDAHQSWIQQSVDQLM